MKLFHPRVKLQASYNTYLFEVNWQVELKIATH